MATTLETLCKIDEQIIRSDSAICRHITNLDALGRGAVSQDILSNLRTFVEHVMFKVYSHSNDTTYDYRIIVHIQDDELIILALEVGHRKDIYKK